MKSKQILFFIASFIVLSYAGTVHRLAQSQWNSPS